MPQSHLADAELTRIYARSRSPVAFVDESHRIEPGEQVGCYTVTAVLYNRGQLDRPAPLSSN